MAFTPVPCPGCGGGGSADAIDVESTLLCDVDATGERVGTALMVQAYDDNGLPLGPPSPVDPATGLPYVVVGTLVPCDEAGVDVETHVLCDVQPDGSSVQFVRRWVYDTDSGVPVGPPIDTGLDGTAYAPTGTVGSCDPYRLCTPSSSQDLNGDCGPGEAASQPVILADGQAPNSVVTDDPTADALCGGTWGPGPDPQTAPFPVDESFRNATFDQPGPVTQGTAPYAGLTASPGWTGSNVDPAGDGWLQTSDINSGTNGLWQVPAPFPTVAGATASITFASHDGTAQGGDGMAFVFTDGGVGPQGAPIGGFGNLGLQNWQGGYVAVVLDEYGQTCTCDHTAPPGGPNPGPCGFCGNTISIQLAGLARQVASCACCTIASAPVAPHQINGTTRATPGRLTVSIIEEGGQTYVSASVLWPGETEPVQYFNRVNVTACAGPSPASLRMAAYGGSGGSFRSEHEFRDAQAIAAGIQDWRAFPIVTDPIPACVTQVNIHAEVDVTFVSDTQTGGNADNEAWFWIVNTATNTVVDRAELTSLPSQVGNPHHLVLDSGLIPVGDLGNYRIYVGAETRDQSGDYGHLWENLVVDVSGAGCPVVPRRTLEISAVCPIPVAIVSGGGGTGGGGAPAVFNAPATFEDAEICIQVGSNRFPGFRREVRTPDGNVAFSFLSTDGIPVTPDTWTPGACPQRDTELLEICDFGTDPPTPFVRRVTYNGDGTVDSAEDVDYIGTPYAPVGPAGRCEDCSRVVLGDVCVVSGDFPGVILPAVAVQACDGTMSYLNPATGEPWPNFISVVVCPPDNTLLEEILCDAGNGGTQFRRIYTVSSLGSIVTYDEDLESDPYVVVGPVEICAAAVTVSDTRDAEILVLCDATPTRFLRKYLYDGETGAFTTVVNTTLDGTTPFVPVGAVGICTTPVATDFDFVVLELCDTNGGFLRRLTFNSQTGAVVSTVNTTLAGAAYVPVGTVTTCEACCPITVGEGCYTGGSGFYTALRLSTGVISLIDSVTGAAVLAADIVPCADDDLAKTLTAQHRLVGDADAPWTPGADVVGILTAVTYTVLSGTATVTDQSGTVAAGLPPGLSSTWNAEDDNTLGGPQSIDAVGGNVYVHWTQR